MADEGEGIWSSTMNDLYIYRSEAGKSLIIQGYDEILKRWPIEYQTRYISTHLGNTHVLACGDPCSPPLVLLHGSSSNATMWIADICDYSRHYRVYALDIPGEPGKSEPARPRLDSDDYAIWLSEVFEELEIQSGYLIGISLGGWLALKFTINYPERVDRLALLCPSGVAPQKGTFLLLALILLPFGRRGNETLMYLLNHKKEMPKEAIQYSCLIAENFRPRMERIPVFSDEELRRIKIPVLLIAGDKDILLRSRQTAERLSRLLPQVEVDMIPEGGHILVGYSNRIISFFNN